MSAAAGPVDTGSALKQKTIFRWIDLLELDKQLDDEEAYDDENPEGYPYREGTAETELGQETPGTPWSQGEGLEEGSAMGDMDDRTELGSVDGDMDMDLEAALNREEDEGATDEEDEDEEVSQGWAWHDDVISSSRSIFALALGGRR